MQRHHLVALVGAFLIGLAGRAALAQAGLFLNLTGLNERWLVNANAGEFIEFSVVNTCGGEASLSLEGFRLQEASPQGGAAFSRDARLSEGQAIFFRHFGPDGVSERTKLLLGAEIACERTAGAAAGARERVGGHALQQAPSR